MAMMDLSSYLSWAFLSSFITLANVMAAIGGLFYVASISMTTVIPLRIAAIASAFFFLCYRQSSMALSDHIGDTIMRAPLLGLAAVAAAVSRLDRDRLGATG
jgi:hypothetical protein